MHIVQYQKLFLWKRGACTFIVKILIKEAAEREGRHCTSPAEFQSVSRASLLGVQQAAKLQHPRNTEN